jgi:hypothetical protein
VPPLPSLTIPTLARLEQQLRFSPKEALLGDILRAEGLASSLDDEQLYPEDWVVFRVTGHRPEVAQPAMIKGEELKGELSSFVERLCDFGKVSITDFDRSALIDADDLCTRWNMSRRTLVRMRKRGLVGRRLLAEDGKPRVMFDAAVVSQFEKGHTDQIARAADYSRISPEDEARIIRRASRYKRWLGWSLNMAAERIAERYSRSHEAIRQVLKRYETRAKEANDRSRAGMSLSDKPLPPVIFDEAQPLTNERREAVYRAWRLGIDPNLVSAKFRRSRPALRRAVAVARAERLIEWADEGLLGDDPEVPLGGAGGGVGHERRDEVIGAAAQALSSAMASDAAGGLRPLRKKKAANPLDAAPVVTGLAIAVPRTINGFFAAARTAGPVVAIEEKARLAAYQHLRMLCMAEVRGLHRLFPRTISLDQIETMMRWAARLKVELVRSHLRQMIETLEGRMNRTMEDLPRTSMPRMLMEGVQRIGEAIDSFDPSRGGRLAAAVSLAMDKHAIRWLKEIKPVVVVGRLRASPLLPNTLDLPDWSLLVCGWQRWLEPHHRVRAAAESGAMDEQTAKFLLHRFGWYGGPPRTLAELSEQFNFTLVRTAIFEQRALYAAMKHGEPGPARLQAVR